MKLVPVLLFCLFFSQALSANDFETTKARQTERLDLQIAELEKAKECMEKATDLGGIKKCNKQKKTALRELKAKLKEKYGKAAPKDEEKAKEKPADAEGEPEKNEAMEME